MMAPGHPEHDLLGVVSLTLPEAWQHALNHLLNTVLAFSGLSLVLGYGVLALALPLLLLPTAFPELSRPRDGLWSLVLAALAPLLLLNRLPVFSSAGFGELIATVLMARLAAEVGQGRWGALTPDQRVALRHLPRWRRAGTDLIAAVVQAAKVAWSATTRTARTAWSAVSDQKDPVVQHQPGPSAQQPAHNPARQHKQWIRPDPSDGTQVNQDQDGETSPEIPDEVPGTGAGASPAPGNASDAEPDRPVADGDGNQGSGSAQAGVEDTGTGAERETTPKQEHPDRPTVVEAVDDTPEERGATEPAESAQPAQPPDGGDGDPGDAKGADGAPEVVESCADPLEAESSEGFAATVVDRVPESGDRVVEEPSAPGFVEPSEAGAKPAQPLDETGNPEVGEADASVQDAENSAPMDMAPDNNPGDAAATGASRETTGASGAETESAQPSRQDWVDADADAVLHNFDEVDEVVRDSNSPTN